MMIYQMRNTQHMALEKNGKMQTVKLDFAIIRNFRKD